MKHFGSIFAVTVTLLMAGSLRADPIYPDVVNTSHATPEVAAFFKSYFTAKSEHKPVPTSDHFSGAHLTYIDATNLSPKERHSWIKLAQDFGYEAHAVFFDVPTETCMERNRKRLRNVPDDVMLRMAQKLRPPKFDEGFAKVIVVRLKTARLQAGKVAEAAPADHSGEA